MNSASSDGAHVFFALPFSSLQMEHNLHLHLTPPRHHYCLRHNVIFTYPAVYKYKTTHVKRRKIRKMY